MINDYGDEINMRIGGFLPTTLLDYPEKLACTVFTCGCNFRCPFCQNGSLVLNSLQKPSAYYEKDDILAKIEKRKHLLEGVCVTGGEPTLQKDLPEFLLEIKKMGLLVKLDTNGSHPHMIKSLYQEHLIDYVAMDIKSSKEHYAFVSGISGQSDTPLTSPDFLSSIEESVEFLMHSGIAYEFRTTLVKGLHTYDDMSSIAQWIKGARKYYLQSYEDNDLVIAKCNPNNRSFPVFDAFSKDELDSFLHIAQTTIPTASLRGI